MLSRNTLGWEGTRSKSLFLFSQSGELILFDFSTQRPSWPDSVAWRTLKAGPDLSFPSENLLRQLQQGNVAALWGVNTLVGNLFDEDDFVACLGDDVITGLMASTRDGAISAVAFLEFLRRGRYELKGRDIAPIGPLVQADQKALARWQKSYLEGLTSPWFMVRSLFGALPAAARPYAFLYYDRSAQVLRAAGLAAPRVEAGAPNAASLGFLTALLSEGFAAALDGKGNFEAPVKGRLSQELQEWYSAACQSSPNLTLNRMPTRFQYENLTVRGTRTQDERLTILEPDREPVRDLFLQEVDQRYKEVPSATEERWQKSKFRVVRTRVDEIHVLEEGKVFLQTSLPHAPEPAPMLEFKELPESWKRALLAG